MGRQRPRPPPPLHIIFNFRFPYLFIQLVWIHNFFVHIYRIPVHGPPIHSHSSLSVSLCARARYECVRRRVSECFFLPRSERFCCSFSAPSGFGRQQQQSQLRPEQKHTINDPSCRTCTQWGTVCRHGQEALTQYRHFCSLLNTQIALATYFNT